VIFTGEEKKIYLGSEIFFLDPPLFIVHSFLVCKLRKREQFPGFF